MTHHAHRLAISFVFLALVASVPAVAAQTSTHTVDYVIGMLEAGVDQPTIISRIHERNLVFKLADGDLDRLRAAGAGEDLVNAVEGKEPPKASPPVAAPGGNVAWSRPRRIDQAPPAGDTQGGAAGQEAVAPGEAEGSNGNDEADDDQDTNDNTPHGGYPYYDPQEDYGYHGYYAYPYAYYGAPYYYDYYPYSFYYSFGYPSYYFYPYPYYYPYRSFYYFGGSIGHRSPGTFVPRGTPRGSSGGMGHPSGSRGSGARPGPRGHH